MMLFRSRKETPPFSWKGFTSDRGVFHWQASRNSNSASVTIPQIAIDVKTAHVDGSAGLLSKNETYSWNWSVTLKNNKSIPVHLTVEDSLPHSSHDRILVKEQFTEPLPEKTDDGLLSWQFDLASGNVQKLTFGYQVSYPEDMQIDKGR